MSLLIIVIYFLVLIFIFFYALIEFALAINYLKSKNSKVHKIEYIQKDHPVVTIQLPIYNEIYVVERLIDAVVNIKWPKEKLEIQVLDDSTDETSAVTPLVSSN